MILSTLVVGKIKTNCYLVGCPETGAALVVDPGDEAERILAEVTRQRLTVQMIVLTHFHFDHVLAAEAVRARTGAPLAIHAREAQHLANPPALFRFFAPGAPTGLVADRLLQDGETITVGTLEVRVLPTPGHSPGGISLWLPQEQVVLTGDALFHEGLGRTDFPGSDGGLLLQSVREQLLTLPEETMVYPGHGPSTTIGHEKSHNPWLSPGRAARWR